ncbi:hypothetical protein ACUXZZ_39420 [Streptomyces graminifolii]|uniref:hypothetical protein n=1 Tax=Streptomyces graminifolii TaxID=1266771 RepID=UPI00405906E8
MARPITEIQRTRGKVLDLDNPDHAPSLPRIWREAHLGAVDTRSVEDARILAPRNGHERPEPLRAPPNRAVQDGFDAMIVQL